MILQTSLAYTQKLPVVLQHIPIHFRTQDTKLFEFFFLLDILKLSLKNYMNTLTPVLKSPIILSPNTILYLILKNGYPFSFSHTIVLNVNAINTSILNYRLLLHNLFQKTLLPLITGFQRIQKDLLVLLHNTNPIFT